MSLNLKFWECDYGEIVKEFEDDFLEELIGPFKYWPSSQSVGDKKQYWNITWLFRMKRSKLKMSEQIRVATFCYVNGVSWSILHWYGHKMNWFNSKQGDCLKMHDLYEQIARYKDYKSWHVLNAREESVGGAWKREVNLTFPDGTQNYSWLNRLSSDEDSDATTDAEISAIMDDTHPLRATPLSSTSYSPSPETVQPRGLSTTSAGMFWKFVSEVPEEALYSYSPPLAPTPPTYPTPEGIDLGDFLLNP